MIIAPQTHAQKNAEAQQEYYYLFYATVKQVKNSVTDASSLKIIKTSKEIDSCKISQFIKIQKKTLKGEEIAFGPYKNKACANTGLAFYKNTIDQITKKNVPKKNSLPNEIYFYRKDLALERIPASIVSGSTKNFFHSFKTGMATEVLTAGPFISYEMAEYSKQLNRLAGRSAFSQSMNFAFRLNNSKKRLAKMQAKIDAGDLKMTKKTVKIQDNNAVVSIGVNIPPNFFNPYSAMILAPVIVKNNKIIHKGSPITLMGEKFEHNYKIVQYKKGKLFISNFELPKQKVREGDIMLKITIFNDRHTSTIGNYKLDSIKNWLQKRNEYKNRKL